MSAEIIGTIDLQGVEVIYNPAAKRNPYQLRVEGYTMVCGTRMQDWLKSVSGHQVQGPAPVEVQEPEPAPAPTEEPEGDESKNDDPVSWLL